MAKSRYISEVQFSSNDFCSQQAQQNVKAT